MNSSDISSRLKTAMQRPLILGASVSADYFTESPGKRLALRYTSSDQVKVVARHGLRGRDVLRSVSDQVLADRTSIICVDTFFWDSLAASPKQSLEALEVIAAFAAKRGIPLILAEVPEFLTTVQKSVVALNEKILELGVRHANCHVLPVNKILQETFERGYITQNGEQISIERLLPDGLHLGEPASEFIANEIAALFQE